jgi:hypothetical protein
MPKPEYVAMRLKKAMEGWGRDSDVMTRMLGGFDGDGMAAVAEAFERKYGQPLWSALKEELKAGNFLSAATAWLSTISSNPARSAERFTELDLSNGDVELPKLVEMLDWLFVENEALLFTHFSARYRRDEILRILDARLPPSLRARVTPLLPAA